MNKERFLQQLQQRIAMLEDAEQQDILAEYAQHIELRVQGGLTEEQAIKDFGDLDALVAEILGAYHVKPGYKPESKESFTLPDPRPGIKKGCGKVKSWLISAWERLRQGCKAFGLWIKGLWLRLKAKCSTLFHRDDVKAPKPREKKEKAVRENEHPIRSVLLRAWRWLCRLVAAVVRLCWNFAVLLCAVPVAGVGIFFLICLGTMLVLSSEGYPLAGLSFISAGIVLVCGSVLGLGKGLIWRRSSHGEEAESLVVAEIEPVEAEQEVEHE